jgi:hypothetical protein
MDPELKALLAFVGILFAWVGMPVLPAWLTFRITPDQRLGLTGPFQGLTLRASGAFSAYLILFLASSPFVWKIGTGLMGRMINDATWTVSGNVRIYDAEGAPVTAPPNMEQVLVRMAPAPHAISPDRVSLRLPFRDHEKPVIYLDIPGWGGGRIAFSDASAFDEDPFTRQIELKEVVILREQPRASVSFGPAAAGQEH